ncbi:hypothetical protein [Actinomadura macrotermitis]|uniref:Peptidase MA superfamily protein n=1 Tax=Actinomadura macrotermitis TaxID=2585200 RepID=A0A7K0BN36_9ACTN|nr:hypothetical protein [Actinomadura macrotermitis]MQY02496.1 hypothetical protein [Actinomadura macrotermitis]
MKDDGPEHCRRPARPRRRGFVAAAGLGAAACLTAGVAFAAARPAGPDASAAGPGAAADAAGRPGQAAVSAVLAGRAAAVRARDRTAFLATVASAPADVQRAQGQLFDNLARLPLEGWQEHYEGVEPGGVPGAANVRVSLRYRLKGFDRGPVVRTRHLLFTPRAGGGWALTGAGSGDVPEIWDGGPLQVVRGRSSLVVGDAPGLPEIARRLDAAVPVVSGTVGKGWARQAVAFAPADPAVAQRLAGDGQDLGQIAALATVAPGPDSGHGGDRIVISPGTFSRLNALGRTVVLTHELTHVATGGARDARTPLWLIEGLADYVGYRTASVGVRAAAGELRREILAGRTPAALPGRAAFEPSGGRLAQSYQEAWLACRMIVERYGEAALVRLYRAAGRVPEPAALREVLGLTPERLTAQWREYLWKELR